jgi:hypothetical protein
MNRHNSPLRGSVAHPDKFAPHYIGASSRSELRPIFNIQIGAATEAIRADADKLASLSFR